MNVPCVFQAGCEIAARQDGVTTDGTHRDLDLADVAESITISFLGLFEFDRPGCVA